nr:hypothetical protein [uncultured Pseudoxanthomonas sp.]
MGSNKGKNPDAATLADIQQAIALPKTWVATGEMGWVDAGGRPPGYKLIGRLALPDGSQPAGLLVAGFFKPARVPGANDKLSLGLHVGNRRVLAIDEDGPGGHFNTVGVGRPYFMQRVGFPHLHTVSHESIEGYAEPLPPATLELHWKHFLKLAGIEGAPPFELPVIQLGFAV